MTYTTEIDYKGDEQITGIEEDLDKEDLYFPDDSFPSDDAEQYFKEDLE